MAEAMSDRIRHAWNAFRGRDRPDELLYDPFQVVNIYRPDRTRLSRGNERSIIASVYTRLSIDISSKPLHHVRLDEEGRFTEIIKSSLEEVLTVSPNIDQTGRAFLQDVAISLFDEGCIAIVPTDTTTSPANSNSYDVLSLRVGKIIEWRPKHVKVRLYNEETGKKEDIILAKSFVAIVENPFYSVMNEPNSTLKRLIRKLNILDAIDEQSGSGKLDIIIQLPYVIKSAARENQAEKRRKMLEDQLSDSKYGVAYTDGTEKITQLNRAAENNLMKQIEYLSTELFNQLGMSEDIFKGTADEKTMLNYLNGTIEPILAAIVDAMKRTFLTKTARTQGQTIMWFNDPFKLVPVANLADIADKLTRNEIVSSNEFRSVIGYRPSTDPRADELRNKNLNASSDQLPKNVPPDVEGAKNKSKGDDEDGKKT